MRQAASPEEHTHHVRSRNLPSHTGEQLITSSMLLQGHAHVRRSELTAAETTEPDPQPADKAPATGNDDTWKTSGGPATVAAERTGAPAAQSGAAEHVTAGLHGGQAAQQSRGGLPAALATGVAPASHHASAQPDRPQVCSAGWTVAVDSETNCPDGGTAREGRAEIQSQRSARFRSPHDQHAVAGPSSRTVSLQGSARTASSLGLDDNDSVWDPGAGGERDALASLTFPADAEPRSTTGTTTGT